MSFPLLNMSLATCEQFKKENSFFFSQDGFSKMTISEKLFRKVHKKYCSCFIKLYYYTLYTQQSHVCFQNTCIMKRSWTASLRIYTIKVALLSWHFKAYIHICQGLAKLCLLVADSPRLVRKSLKLSYFCKTKFTLKSQCKKRTIFKM